MLHALVLAAICDRYAVDIIAHPPALLTGALAQRYRDNADINAEVTVAGGPAPEKVRLDTKDAELDAVVQQWARASTFRKRAGCDTGATGLVSLTFFPAWTGAAAYPHIARGVNFDNLEYGRGPCGNSDPAEFTPFVEDLFTGRLSGSTVALVQLRCQFPVGFNSELRAYRIEGGKAIFAGKLAEFAYPAPDDPYVEHGWVHVRFARNVVFVDAWQYFKRCRKSGDWIVSSYRLRGGKLNVASSVAHHRASVAWACDEGG